MSNESTESDLRWDNFVLRMKSEARDVLANNRQRGIAVVRAKVMIDADGNILLWVIPSGERIEPTKDAREIVGELLQSV